MQKYDYILYEPVHRGRKQNKSEIIIISFDEIYPYVAHNFHHHSITCTEASQFIRNMNKKNKNKVQ